MFCGSVRCGMTGERVVGKVIFCGGVRVWYDKSLV